MTTRIHVLSLSDYNEGRLIGAWIDTEDQTSDELYEAIQTEVLNKSKSIVAEEWVIADYEGYPFDATELSLETIEAIEEACKISENREAMLALLSLFPEYRQSCYSSQQLSEHFFDRYQGEHESDKEFAFERIDSMLSNYESSHPLVQYFDHEMYQRELMYDFCSENNHYFYSN